MARVAAGAEGAEPVRRLGTVGSTNAVAAEAAAAGEAGPVWFVAERQTAGRGRRGRAWVSEAGNLYASCLFRTPADPAGLSVLPLAAAVALGEALADGAGLAARVRLKWPNDVLVDGAKVAGILLEARHGAGEGMVAVIAGFGVNCASAPADAPYRVASLSDRGAPRSPEAVLSALVPAFAAWRGRPFAAGGIAAVREAWLARASGLGEPILVRQADGEAAGTFAGLDEGGRLVLEGADGTRRRFAAGDVFEMTATRAGPHKGEVREGC